MMGEEGEMKLGKKEIKQQIRGEGKKDKVDGEEGRHYVKQNTNCIIFNWLQGYSLSAALVFNHLFPTSFFLSHTLSP